MMRNININELVWKSGRTTPERVNLPEKKLGAGTIFLRTSYLVPLVSTGLSYLFRGRGYRRHAVAKLCFKLKLYAVPFLGSYGAVILAKCLARMFRFTNLEQAAARHIRLRVQLRLLENHRLPSFLNFYSKNSLWTSLPRDRRNWGWFRSQLFDCGEATSRSFLRLPAWIISFTFCVVLYVFI